jgi:hypothetical protein
MFREQSQIGLKGRQRLHRVERTGSGNSKASDPPLLFPKRQPRDVSMFAPMVFDARFSADWAEEQEKRAAARRIEQERVAAFYEGRVDARNRRD